MDKSRIIDATAEIQDELKDLDALASDIQETWNSLPQEMKERRIHEESLALKLHNFYTGCERIFQRIADDINGGTPRSSDWHKRLLHSMTLELEGIRPAVISKETEKALSDFLGFRHIVRNIYGFKIDSERLQLLLARFHNAFQLIRNDVRMFSDFLKKLV
jgi:hypothetical protein